MKPVAKPRQYLQHKSLSASQLKLPQLPQQKLQAPADDSPRPSVQFNMTGRHTPNMMTQRGILQHRESLSSSQDITPSSPSAGRKSKLRRPSTLPTFAKQANESKIKSCETLPFITDPYRTAIPRFNRSVTDLHIEPAVFPPGALPRPIKPNPNPTRKQKGLLRILNGNTSHLPLRSNWASMEDLPLGRQLKTPLATPTHILQSRRRSSSTSPERRSSTQTASDRRSSNISSVTTSDFSFRRSPLPLHQQRRKSSFPSTSPKTKRRQSLIQPASLSGGRTSRTKVAKPSTLSPIIGTPNKDSSTPQSPEQNIAGSLAPSEAFSDMTSRRDSLSKIPLRSSNSRPISRSSSPLKEFMSQLPISDINSRGTSSRTTSRATVRTDASQSVSRSNSRPASRSTSRASTHPISRAASRASTRPNSRMEMAKEIANSRSNSRMSILSTASITGNVSPNSGKRSTEPSPVTTRRRTSISVSPVSNRKVRTRRQSLSPPHKKRSGSRGRGKKIRERSESRHSSRSRIPLRDSSVTKAKQTPSVVPKELGSRSPSKSKGSKMVRRTTPAQTPSNQRKNPKSAKKVPTSIHKPESNVKRKPSSVGKLEASIKKQPSNLQKPGRVNLIREPSNVRKKETPKTGTGKNIRREGTATTITTKKAAVNSSAAAVALTASGLKRHATTKNSMKFTTKSNTVTTKGKGNEKKAETTKGNNGDNNAEMTKQEEKKASSSKEDASNLKSVSPVGIETTKIAAIPVGVAAVAATSTKGAPNISSGSTGSSGSTSGIKKHPSNASLVRMASRMSLLSMKRSDSNLSKKATVPAVAEETTDGLKKTG